jgi:hypothetical protein
MRRRKSKDKQHSLVDIYYRQRLQYNHYKIEHTNYLITGDPSDDYCAPTFSQVNVLLTVVMV